MTRNFKLAPALVLVLGLTAVAGTAVAGDSTRIVVNVDNGRIGLGLSYYEGGYGAHPRYVERYRYPLPRPYPYYAYRAPPPPAVYAQGYRDGYRDGRHDGKRGGYRHQHRDPPGRSRRYDRW
jgi:hypothetical protein